MRRALLLCTTILLAASASAADRLTPEDIMAEVSVSSPAVSPDGRWIVYSVSSYDPEAERKHGDLFLIPFGGGEPRQLTASPGVESSPAWAPDSRHLAFTAKRGDDEEAQIYVLDVTGGEARRITEVEEGTSEPLYSPDGKWIAFTSEVGERLSEAQREAFGDVRYVMHPRFYHLGPGWDKGKRQRIFVMPSAGGEARQLTDGKCADEGDHSMAWSPDSKEIAFVANRSPEWFNTIDTDIYVVDVEAGETRRLTTNPGPDHDPVFSPDGRWIAYRASQEYNYESEVYTIHVVAREGGKPRELGEGLDRDVRSLAWAKDSSELFFLLSSEGTRHLHTITLGERTRVSKVTSGKEFVSDFHIVENGRFVLRASTDSSPSEIYTLVDGKLTRLTDDATSFWDRFEVQPCEEIVVSAEDGTRLQGWLVRPVGYEAGTKVPMVLSIHGGPHGMYSPQLRSTYQLLANQGYAVLFANPRGSAGYGQEFADAIYQDWHTKPFADLMRFVDRVIEMGVADPERLAVMGGSYGGYMTNWIIGHTDRFAAALSSAGLSNMVSFWGTTDEQFFAEKEMGGPPWRTRDVHLDNSPLWAAESFTTPTLLMHGENDWRVRPEQGRQLFVALQKVGVPCVYVEFPDEQHGVRKPDHRLVYNKLMLEWFDHWLQGKPVELATYITPRAYVHPPTSAEDKGQGNRS